MYQFIAENPWQFFFMGPFILILLGGAYQFVLYSWNRLLRTIKVLFRGWPPEHLDADGDSVEVFTERAKHSKTS